MILILQQFQDLRSYEQGHQISCFQFRLKDGTETVKLNKFYRTSGEITAKADLTAIFRLLLKATDLEHLSNVMSDISSLEVKYSK